MKHACRMMILLLMTAKLDFGRAVAAPPTNIPQPFNISEAQVAYSAKNYKRTISILSSQLDIANRDGFLLLAKAYTALENHMMAMKTLTTAKAKFSADPEVATSLGLVQLTLGKDRDAKATLKDVTEAHPKFEPAYLAIAEIYKKQGNKYELRIIYQDLLKEVGPKPPYLDKLCELTTQDALYDQAFDFCNRAMKANPAEPNNYIYLASANKETGKTPEADVNYKRAADSFSKSEPAQFAYASFLDEQKKYVDSYPYYKRAIVADPKSIRSWLGLAEASIEIQKFSEALSAFERVCELDSREGLKQVRRAASQIRKLGQPNLDKKFSRAISKCEKANPNRMYL